MPVKTRRVFIDIPEPARQAIESGWRWVLCQGVELLDAQIKDDWFNLYMEHAETGLLQGLLHEFQVFRSFGVDLIVDFAEIVEESQSRQWNDALATLVSSESELGRLIEAMSDRTSYFDTLVELLEATVMTNDTLEILSECLQESLTHDGVELDRIKDLSIDVKNHMFVIYYS